MTDTGLMNIFFGTDGWRGIDGKEVNEESIKKVARAFAEYLIIKKESNKAAVGYDGRKNSAFYAEVFASVLAANNIETELSHSVIPTPVLSYYVKHKQLDAGVMITASHNPPEYNGVKFKDSYGGPFMTEETLKVEELLGKKRADVGGAFTKSDMLSFYIDSIKKKIDFMTISESGTKVLVDSMSGAGGRLIEEILRSENCAADTIYSIPEPDFSGRLAEPIAQNLEPAFTMLEQSGCYAMGLASDGDADRLGVLLDNGEFLSAQETILMLADYIVNTKQYPGHIVKTSSVTDVLAEAFTGGSRKVYDVQVGFKYICEKMIEDEISFGCEESGGFGYHDHIPERDGIFSALLFTEMLAKSGCKKLSEFLKLIREKYGYIFYRRIDWKYSDDDRAEVLPNLAEEIPEKIAGFAVKDFRTFNSSRGIVNGVKFLLEGNRRWLLIRASETEPLVRLYAEGNSNNEVEDLLMNGKVFFERK